MPTIPIVVLHGLGDRVWTMTAFLTYLNWCGFDNVIAPRWPANKGTLEECLDSIETSLQRVQINKTTPIIVIGNSMGGVMAMHLHTRGFKIKKAIAVASPLNGALVFRTLEDIAPKSLFNIFYQPGHAYLRRTDKLAEPPHPYRTISFGLGFDGQVFESDIKLDEKYHTRFRFGTHYSLVMDPRVWQWIRQEIE